MLSQLQEMTCKAAEIARSWIRGAKETARARQGKTSVLQLSDYT